MTTWVALLRGINVGGRSSLPMAELRRILADLGHDDVRTYIQSGNAVFTNDRTDADAIAAELRDRLGAELDVHPAVVVRTAQELRAAADANPYAEQAAADPTKVHLGLLTAAPPDPSVFAFHPAAYAPDEAVLGDRVLYLHLPDGMGRSRLAQDLGRRRTDVEVTVRNWRTVAKLLELSG